MSASIDSWTPKYRPGDIVLVSKGPAQLVMASVEYAVFRVGRGTWEYHLQGWLGFVAESALMTPPEGRSGLRFTFPA